MNPDNTNWQAEATFWQSRYFELFLHTSQIIAALSRPLFAAQQNSQQDMQALMAALQQAQEQQAQAQDKPQVTNQEV